MKRYESTKTDRPVAVGFTSNEAIVILANGDALRTPLSLHPWLERATPEQRANREYDASAVYWPDLDDGLDIEWMRRQPVPLTNDELLERFHRLNQDAQTLALDIIDAIARREKQSA